ncbi:MAG: T9SS type A sorting domain-containing protein [candidate division Zixibacteria bacterium]|nr:T9SS type A sorting domain-containing protein [candidate division Zixibacteria bacterium]
MAMRKKKLTNTMVYLKRSLITVAFTLALAANAFGSATEIGSFIHNGFRQSVQIDTFLVCALEGGIGVYTLAKAEDGSSAKVENLVFIPMNGGSLSMRFDDDILTVRYADTAFRIFDMSQIPRMRTLGTVFYAKEIQDYLYYRGNMFFAEEFRGVSRYSASNFQSLVFADSSMYGIQITQLSIRGDTLFAVDNYNGILRYVNPAGGLNNILDYQYVPFPVERLTFSDNGTYLLADRSDGFVRATFDSSGYIDSSVRRQTVTYASRILESDSNYIILSGPNIIEVQSKSDSGDIRFISPEGNTWGATIFKDGAVQLLITPSSVLGLGGYKLNVADFPRQFSEYEYPGPITGLEVIDSRLYTVGRKNDLEQYALNLNPMPTLLGSRSYLTDVTVMTSDGSMLYAVVNLDGASFLWGARTSYNDLPFPIDAPPINAGVDMLKITDSPTRGKFLLYRALGNYYLSHSENWEFFGFREPAIRIQPTIGLIQAVVAGDYLISHSSKFGYAIHYITSPENLPEVSPLNVDAALSIVTYGFNQSDLLFLGHKRLAQISIIIPAEPEIKFTSSIRGSYTNFTRLGDLVFAVGPNSTGIISLSNIAGYPIEIFHTPVGAKLVAATEGQFFTSDGTSIRVYDYLATDVEEEESQVILPDAFNLSWAFPNPFNGVTTIEFSGNPAKFDISTIGIYNILGQLVSELNISETGDSEGGRIQWDGRDSNGSTVSSGVYFARPLQSAPPGQVVIIDNRRSIKLVYLK